MTERKFALTRLAAGDYLLPGNDGLTLWRIARYEDGPSHGLQDWPRDIEFWGAWRWDYNLGPNTIDRLDTDTWDQWSLAHTFHDTRASAIRAALDDTEPNLDHVSVGRGPNRTS